ncbi:BLUF domain-containing protein [Devosia submarina]|uniref:BLUF domain-containing protein n=1 Tax=Devosia submarina TaxID=1173082 RepID=UPI000D3ABAC5|nr:BLUF domain-containing protein [Devosia submarina]
MDLWNWIYISRSCISSADIESEITDIVDQSRLKNAELEVTGVLVFDGTHFAQLVEGPETNVRALRAAIESDARHQDIKTVLDSAATERRLPNWSLAYSGRSLVISRAIRRAMRDIEQGQPDAGTRLGSFLIDLAV